MTTTPVTLLSKGSGNTSDRPLDTTIQAGELAINFAAAEMVYFKDSVGAIRKVTGVHYGSSAPNSTPAGETGNSVGEIWVDSGTNNFCEFGMVLPLSRLVLHLLTRWKRHGDYRFRRNRC